MKRRKFIAGFGGAVATWPLAARAQQGERVRRIGVLQGLSADDPEARHRTAVFLERLQQAGWIDGRNRTIDFRWALVGNPDLLRRYAAELVSLEPDVILCSGSALLAALLAVTRSIPIVFTIVGLSQAFDSRTVTVPASEL
jgi:putative tryptophan/tyrosine transport system substrate-binding protein